MVPIFLRKDLWLISKAENIRDVITKVPVIISETQFEDIKKQEGRRWYNKELFLGEIAGLEIKTITGDWEREKNEPSQKYLYVIKKGIKETTGWEDFKIEGYLKKFYE